MTIRKYVAGQLIRLARKIDPNCCMDWKSLTAVIEDGNGIAAQLERDNVRNFGGNVVTLHTMSPLEFRPGAPLRWVPEPCIGTGELGEIEIT